MTTVVGKRLSLVECNNGRLKWSERLVDGNWVQLINERSFIELPLFEDKSRLMTKTNGDDSFVLKTKMNGVRTFIG
jgi:hypothetical protein